MKRFTLGLILGAALSSVLASAQSRIMPTQQQRNILVGDAELRLGMSKDAVRRAFSKGYVLRENETKGIGWLVYGQKDDPNGPSLAGLTFSQDTLSAVIKPWLKGSVRENRAAVVTGNAVFGILANFAEAGETHCSLKVNHDDTPDHSSKVAIIKCGEHSLAVAVTSESGAGEGVDVQELLSHGDQLVPEIR